MPIPEERLEVWEQESPDLKEALIEQIDQRITTQEPFVRVEQVLDRLATILVFQNFMPNPDNNQDLIKKWVEEYQHLIENHRKLSSGDFSYLAFKYYPELQSIWHHLRYEFLPEILNVEKKDYGGDWINTAGGFLEFIEGGFNLEDMTLQQLFKFREDLESKLSDLSLPEKIMDKLAGKPIEANVPQLGSSKVRELEELRRELYQDSAMTYRFNPYDPDS